MEFGANDSDAVAEVVRPTGTAARILLVQYAGDFREAHRRLQEDGVETYFGHHYVLEQLARLRRDFGEVAILCCKSEEAYSERLPSGVLAVGGGNISDVQGNAVTDRIEAYMPTHLVVLGPFPRLIRWGLRNGCRTMCLFADSFEVGPLRRFLRFGLLARLLNDPRIEVVANHSLNACLSLARIGVERGKIVPWDWVHTRQPRDVAPKSISVGQAPTLLFVGSVIERKGIGDVVAAVQALRCRGIAASLKVVGAGEIGRYKALARRLGVGDAAEFLGLLPNTAVIKLMQQATLVVVPSKHTYPEGMPLTVYEALCARTPLVASDHPMFRGRLIHRQTAMIYAAGNPKALARCVEELMHNPALYHAISVTAQRAWEGLQISAKWGEILHHWLADGEADHRWLRANAIDAAMYASQEAAG